MPTIRPNPEPPRRPAEPRVAGFENRTPESFAAGGFVNAHPAGFRPAPEQGPAQAGFQVLTPADFQAPPARGADAPAPLGAVPPRPELRIDTGVGGGRPVGEPASSAPSHTGETTISAYSIESGRRAPMHPSFFDSPSPGSGLTYGSSAPSTDTRPNTPWPGVEDGARIAGVDAGPELFRSRTPTPQPEPLPEPMAYPMPLPLSPSREPSFTPRPESVPTVILSPRSRLGESPRSQGAPSPESYPSSPGEGFAPTPGYAPTPGGYLSPTPGAEEAAHLLLSLNPSPHTESPLPSRAPTPGYAPTPGGYFYSPSPEAQ
jgi:hypothetical protein